MSGDRYRLLILLAAALVVTPLVWWMIGLGEAFIVLLCIFVAADLTGKKGGGGE